MPSHHHTSRSAAAASTAAFAAPASHCLLRPQRQLPSRPHKQRLRAAAFYARNKRVAACLALVLSASTTLSRAQQGGGVSRARAPDANNQPLQQQQRRVPLFTRDHPEVIRLPSTRPPRIAWRRALRWSPQRQLTSRPNKRRLPTAASYARNKQVAACLSLVLPASTTNHSIISGGARLFFTRAHDKGARLRPGLYT